MQEVLMLMSLNRPRSHQRALFSPPNPPPEWQELSPETQQKALRLLALLLRQQGATASAAPTAEEESDE
jgi:hypothetical protein